MNSQNSNKTTKTDEARQALFRQPTVCSMKYDLEEILEKIDKVWSQMENERLLQLSLEEARDNIEEVYDEIREKEKEADELIKSIAGWNK
jgi:hypothetical protein